MKEFFLKKIRLSWYLGSFLVIYFIALFFLPNMEFTGGTLTLFSVNSFLYGFYISPVLSAQKARIEDMHRIVRSEANAIFAMMLIASKLSAKNFAKVKSLFDDYIQSQMVNNVALSEKTYQALITMCLEAKGADKDVLEKLLEKLIANQQNRTNLNMQLNNKVYSNEWWIMIILFSITLTFILLIDTGSTLGTQLVTALLCTGLSMLMLNLIKLNSLTHKKAKLMWKPLQTLVQTRYYQID